ncbi:hypothetical protein M8J76_010470 [Diaphorina citri]|nr:hypothetical protein M8J76_010470 [Diaphorina citri]
MSVYGLSMPKEKVQYPDEYNSQFLPELERQWKIRGDKKNIEAALDRPSLDDCDVRMYRPAATHYFMGAKIDLNDYRPIETMNQTIHPYLPYNEYYLRPGFDPVAWHHTIRDMHWEINPDSELSDPEIRKLFTVFDSENFGDKATEAATEDAEDDDAKEKLSDEDYADSGNVDYYRSSIYADSMLTTAELAEKKRRKLLKANATKKTTPRMKRKYSLAKTMTPPTTKSYAEIARILNARWEREKTTTTTLKPYHPDDSAPIHPMFRQHERLRELYPNVSRFQDEELNELDQWYVREKDILNTSSFTINMQNLRNIELRHNLKISELPPVPTVYWVHPNRTEYVPEEDNNETTYPPTDYIVTESIETYMNITPFNIMNIRNIEKKFNITLNDDLVTEFPDSIVRLNDFLTVRADRSNDYHDLINYFSPLKRRRREILDDLQELIGLNHRSKRHSHVDELLKTFEVISNRKRRSVKNSNSDSKENKLKRWENYEDLTKIVDGKSKANLNEDDEIKREEATPDPTQNFYYSNDEELNKPEPKVEEQNNQNENKLQFSKDKFDMNKIKDMNSEELRRIRDYQLEHSAEIQKYLEENRDFIYQHKDEIFDEEHHKLAKAIRKKIGDPPTKAPRTAIPITPEVATEDPFIAAIKKENERRDRLINEQIYRLSNIRNKLAPLPGNKADYIHLKLGWRITEEPVIERNTNDKPKKDDGKIDPFQPYFKIPSGEMVNVAPETTTLIPLNFQDLNKKQVEDLILKHGIQHVIKLSRQRTTMSYKEFKRKRLLEGRTLKGEIRPRPKSNKERINALFDENWKIKDIRLKRRRDSKREKKEKLNINKIPFYVRAGAKDQRARLRIFDKKVVFKVDHLEGNIVTQKVTLKRPVGPLHYHVKKRKGDINIMDGDQVFKLVKETTTIRTRAPYDPDHESDYSEEDRPVNKGVDFETSEEEHKEKSRSQSEVKSSHARSSKKKSIEEKKKKLDSGSEEVKIKDIKYRNRHEYYDSLDYVERKKKRGPELDDEEKIKQLNFHSCGSIKETAEVEEKARRLMKGFRKRKQKVLLRRKHAKYYNFTEKSLISSESETGSYYEPENEEVYVTTPRKFRYVKEYDGSKVLYTKEYFDTDESVREILKKPSKTTKVPHVNTNNAEEESEEKTETKADIEIPDLESQTERDEKRNKEKVSSKRTGKNNTVKRVRRFLRLSTPPRHTTKGFDYLVQDPAEVEVTHLTGSGAYEEEFMYMLGQFDVTLASTKATTTIRLLPEDYWDMNKYKKRSKRDIDAIKLLQKEKLFENKMHIEDLKRKSRVKREFNTDWWETKTRTVFTRPATDNFEDLLMDPIIHTTFDYDSPKHSKEYVINFARRKRSCGKAYNSNMNPDGSFGNYKISVDILMRSIMQRKKLARRRRNADTTTLSPEMTEYMGQIEDDPYSNCCNNSASREYFRDGVRRVKMKKFKHDLDIIRPRTTPTTPTTPPATTRGRARRSLEDLYPSIQDSGESHNLKKYGIGSDDATVTIATRTRWPTPPKIMDIPKPTKTNLILEVEKRFSLKLEDLTTPYTLQWSPYGLVITNSEDLDSDSELEVMDWYEERESPTWTTVLTTSITNATEPTLFDYDGMTQFNIENIRKIEKKFNVSLKDFENRTDNMVIEASTLNFGLVGFAERLKNISLSKETLIDKFEPNLEPVFPTDMGFYHPDGGGRTVDYGHRDWVLKDLMRHWKNQENGSFETLHRQAQNLTMEKKKQECIRLGIPWTEPLSTPPTTKYIPQEFTGSTFNPQDEAILEDHCRFVHEVNEYNKKHDLFPKKYTQETYNPRSAERERTIMDWILRDYTDIRQEHEKRLSAKPSERDKHKREITSANPQNTTEFDLSNSNSNEGRVYTAKDFYQTLDDPDEIAKAIREIHDNGDKTKDNTIGREELLQMLKESAGNGNQSGITIGINRRMKREMPYLGYSGLTSRIIFQWTNYPYDKTMAPYFVRRKKIQARHRPTNKDGVQINFRRKLWTVHTTEEAKLQTLKFVHGIPVHESLDYGMTVKPVAVPRNKREVPDKMRDIEDYTDEKDGMKVADYNVDPTIISKEGRDTTVAYNTNITEEVKDKDVSCDEDGQDTKEPPPSSRVKFRTVYHREKRGADRFMEYLEDPIVRTVYANKIETPSTKYPEARPTTSTQWGSYTSWYHPTTEALTRQKRFITQRRVLPYIRAHAFDERATDHSFEHFLALDAKEWTVDRLRRNVNDKVRNVAPTESWLKRHRREMPYLGYSGLTSRIIFQWTNYPYDKTMAPYFVRRKKIQARHRPTNKDGVQINFRRKLWTVHTTEEAKLQTLKFVHGIPVHESLDYGMTVKPIGSPRNKRDVGSGSVEVLATNSTTTTSVTTASSDTTTGKVEGADIGNMTTINGTVGGDDTASNINGSSTAKPTTTNPLAEMNESQPGAAAFGINPVQTLNRKKRDLHPNPRRGKETLNRKKRDFDPHPRRARDLQPHLRRARYLHPHPRHARDLHPHLNRNKRDLPHLRRGKDLFEKIIMAYYNCKNVWKEAHSPEILQIRRRYKEQKNRAFNRIFGRRHHNHEDVYYDRK